MVGLLVLVLIAYPRYTAEKFSITPKMRLTGGSLSTSVVEALDVDESV